MNKNLAANKVDDGGREAVQLENGLVRVVIDSQGGMMPEFSIRRGAGWFNVHYLPHFRGNGSPTWNKAKHEAFWKVGLLYHLAGDFLCAPNFGGACSVDGTELPPHGQAASAIWKLEGYGSGGKPGAAWAKYSMDMPGKTMPLSFIKYDVVLDGQAAFYSLLHIKNRGSKDIAINLGRHATIGAPFLQAGCQISVSAERFMAPPKGSEFDTTGRVAGGVEFNDLAAAPLRAGGTVDLGIVPGPIGYSDLVAGAIPAKADLGWSCVVNPALDMAFVNFFPGPAALEPDEVAPTFDVLWMQYGGRPFTPWATRDGSTDLSYCLGTEHTASGFANGLEYARQRPELLGAPTTVTIPAGATRIFRYGSVIAELGGALRGPVKKVSRSDGELALRGAKGTVNVAADSGFKRLSAIAAMADKAGKP
jgi:hypothetical protein